MQDNRLNQAMRPWPYIVAFFVAPVLCYVGVAIFRRHAPLPGILLLSGALSQITAWILFPKQAWRLLGPAPGRPSPNSAFLLLIPLFHWFWQYRMYYRLGDVIQQEAKRFPERNIEPAETLSKAFCHLFLVIQLAPCIMFLFFGRGTQAAVFGVVYALLFLLWLLDAIMMFWHYAKTVSQLAALKSKAAKTQ
jgi:hypothetical protein